MRRMITSGIWSTGFAKADGVKGLKIRTPLQENDKVEVMLEQWDEGTSEPPHSHPGDDQTIVVEGKMTVQKYLRMPNGELKKDGDLIELKKGDSGFIPANVIHDAKYLTHCKLVYIHNHAFGFTDETTKRE